MTQHFISIFKIQNCLNIVFEPKKKIELFQIFNWKLISIYQKLHCNCPALQPLPLYPRMLSQSGANTPVAESSTNSFIQVATSIYNKPDIVVVVEVVPHTTTPRANNTDGKVRTSRTLEVDREVMVNRSGLAFWLMWAECRGVQTLQTTSKLSQLNFAVSWERAWLSWGLGTFFCCSSLRQSGAKRFVKNFKNLFLKLTWFGNFILG